MSRRKKPGFVAGKSQMFAVLTPETGKSMPMLWTYTTFSTVADAQAYIKWRCEQMCHAIEAFLIVPCETTVQISP